MSDIFIQNEAIRAKIAGQYFKDKAPTVIENDSDSDSDSNMDSDNEIDPDISKNEDTVYSRKQLVQDLEQNTTNENKTFHFLGLDEGSLNYDFGLCNSNPDITKQYTVYICGYNINETDGTWPFLQYMVQFDGTNFTFPKFQFRCATNITTEEDEEMTPEHVYFKNECIKHILSIFDIDYNENGSESGSESGSENDSVQDNSNILSRVYKGFVQSKIDDNSIYVVFDLNGFVLQSSSEKIRRIWATIDEIMNEHKLLGYNIEPIVYNLFFQTPALMHLKNAKGEILDSPKVLFLCKQENGTYNNVYNETSGSISLFDERINHSILGNFYIFSLVPLDYETLPIFNIRRFVGFFVQPIYILKDLTQIKPKNIVEKVTSYKLGDVIPNIVSYFSKEKEEPTKKMGGKVDELEDPNEELEERSDKEKSEEILDNEGSETSENLEEPDSKTEPKEEILEDDDESEQNSQEIANLSNLKNSCIYFQEDLGEMRVAFWCIKSTLHFTEL